MEFTGTVMQDGRPIGEWKARLVGPQITGTDRWHCTVRIRGDVTSEYVTHTYADGVSGLISKCLLTHTESAIRKVKLKEPHRPRTR